MYEVDQILTSLLGINSKYVDALFIVTDADKCPRMDDITLGACPVSSRQLDPDKCGHEAIRAAVLDLDYHQWICANRFRLPNEEDYRRWSDVERRNTLAKESE